MENEEAVIMSKIGGYAGKILRVDLTTEKITEEIISEEMWRKYLGGTGLGAKFLYEEVPPKVEWSDPQNLLVLAAGPLNGTRIGGSGTFSIVTKGPMTNGATSTQANGFFGAYMKFCGYDGIITEGTSKDWVYLHVDDKRTEICDAKHLLGKSTYETEDFIKKEQGKKEHEMSVASVGPAGENLVRFAGVFVDKGHAAAHNGPGTVMSSKKLKAIAVNRGKIQPLVKDKGKLAVIAAKMAEDVKNLSKDLYEWGTLASFVGAYAQHYLPVKNYSTNVWDIADEKLAKFKAQYIREHYEAKPHSCWACQIHHCHIMRIPDGPYVDNKMEEPEYEQLAAWSAVIGNTDIDATMMLSKEVDSLGMDTNEAGWIISFLMEAYEKKLLSRDDLDGLEMNWGNVEATRQMLNKIASRKGIGDLLAEGVMRAAKRIGGNANNLAICTAKGNTPRGHDHRVRLWEGFDTCVSNTGTFESPMLAAIGPQDWRETATAVGKMKGRTQFEDSMVTCRFNTRTNLELLAQALSAVTGWDYTFEEAIVFGRRIVNLMRAFNVSHGLTTDLDYPSTRYSEAIPDGPYKGRTLISHWNEMLRVYYRELGWDERTGKPLPETLEYLGLRHVIKDIW